MDMLPIDEAVSAADVDDDDASSGNKVALAKFNTSDSAPPMPRSRWMKTT